MSRSHPTRPGPRAAAIEPHGPSRGVLALVWIAIAVYVVLFFASPLSSASAAGGTVLRRVHILMSLFFGDDLVRQWFEGWSWHVPLQRLRVALLAAAIFAVAWAAGWIGLWCLGVQRQLTRVECFVFAAAIGLNLVSLKTLALGLCGILVPSALVASAVAILIVAGALFFYERNRDRSNDTQRDLPAEPGADHWVLDARWLWLGVPFALFLVLGAMLPPVDFDVREYHLQAPKEFYQSGRIDFLPHNVYANMPLGTEMLSLIGMIAYGDWWHGALVGKTLIALYAPLAALALWAAGRRFATPTAGVIAALVYISIPWIALVSVNGLVDGAFAFYLFVALFGVLFWQQSLASDRRCDRWLCLAGFLAGAAVSIKYPAVLFCVLPLAATIVAMSLRGMRQTKGTSPARLSAVVKPIVLFLAFAALGCGVWLAKNAVVTGNPVYPLLVSVFDGRTRTPEKDAQWTRVHNPPNFAVSDLGKRAIDVTLASDWLSPLVMPLAALSLFGRWRRTAWWLAVYFGFVFITWWLLTHRIDRFWVPILPVLALLAGLGATWTNARWWRVPFLSFLVLGLISNFVVIVSGPLADNRYLADYDLLRRDPLRVDAWHLYLNEHAGAVTGVLLVGDAQPYDLEVPTFYNTVFDDSLLEQLADGRAPEEVQRALAERHISHVYVAWGEVRRYRSAGNYGITDFIQPEVFDRLVAAGVLEALPPINEHSGQMFRVVPPSERSTKAASSP